MLPHLSPLLLWPLSALPLIALLKSRWAKGHLGELLARFAAYLHLDQKTYRRLHNLTLDTPDGTTQIDHCPRTAFSYWKLRT